jgi:hypothetical protein
VKGLIGWGIDAASGADSRLVPEAVTVKLDPEKQAGPTLEKSAALDSDLKNLDEMLAAGTISQEEHTSLRQKAIEKY